MHLVLPLKANQPCYHHSTSASLDLQVIYTINLKQKNHPLQTKCKLSHYIFF